MDRQDLHGARLRIFGARGQAITPLGLAQPAQEPAETRGLVDRDVAGQRVEERLFVGAAQRQLLVGDDLDVEPQLLLDERDEIEQVEGRARPQPGEGAAGLAQPLDPQLAEPGKLGVAGRARSR